MISAKIIRWFLLIIAFLGITGRFITGSALYARLAYISIFVLVTSYIWSVYAIKNIILKRDSRVARASMGDVFEEHFEIMGVSWPGTLWMEVINATPLPDAAGSRLLTGISARQRRFYSVRSVLKKRGSYQLGPTIISSGDLFGLFQSKKEFPAIASLLVLPMTVNIPTFPPPQGILPGGKAIRQKTMDVTPHAAGVREYIPGDPMKRIHWPSTARRERFMVKEFEQDPQADIWIFLDAQKDHHYEKETKAEESLAESFLLRRPKISLPCDSFEYGVCAAASLVKFFLAENRGIGLACASSKLMIISAEKGERPAAKILETLAFLQPKGEMSFLSLINLQTKILPIGSGVILITASASPELVVVAENLQRRNLQPVCIFLETSSFGGPEYDYDVSLGFIKRNIPHCQIRFGDDIGEKLSLPVVYFQRQDQKRHYFIPK